MMDAVNYDNPFHENRIFLTLKNFSVMKKLLSLISNDQQVQETLIVTVILGLIVTFSILF